MKSKKASLFSWMLVLITAAALVATVIVIDKLEEAAAPKISIGARAFRIQETQYEADKLFAFTKQSARIAAYESIMEAAKKGGHPEQPCGSFQEYALWNSLENPEKLCFPDIQTTLTASMNKKMHELLKNHPLIHSDIPEQNYEITADDKRITGFALAPAIFNMQAPTEKVLIPLKSVFWKEIPTIWPDIQVTSQQAWTGVYIARPSFELQHNYRFSDYAKLMQLSARVLDSCKNKKLTEAKNCISQTIANTFASELDLTYSFHKQENKNIIVLLVSAKQNADIPFSVEKPVIKFALAIPLQAEEIQNATVS